MVTLIPVSDLRAIARTALVGGPGSPSLEALVNKRMFGRRAPKYWGQWSDDAKHTWLVACRLYDDLLLELRNGGEAPQLSPSRRRERKIAGLQETWRAVEEVSGPRSRWWTIPNVTWSDLAVILNISPSATLYRYNTLGWRFVGSRSTRKVTKAPCVDCGTTQRPQRIEERRGPCCVEHRA